MGNCTAFRLNCTGTSGNLSSPLLTRASIVTLAFMRGLLAYRQQCDNNTNNTSKILRKQAKSSTPSSGTIVERLPQEFTNGGNDRCWNSVPTVFGITSRQNCFPNLHGMS